MSAIQGLGETSRTSSKFCWHTETFFCDLHARLEFIDRRAERERCCYNDLQRPVISKIMKTMNCLIMSLLGTIENRFICCKSGTWLIFLSCGAREHHDNVPLEQSWIFENWYNWNFYHFPVTTGLFMVWLHLSIGSKGVCNWSDLWRLLANEDLWLKLGEEKNESVARDTYRKIIQITTECSFEICLFFEAECNEMRNPQAQ